MDPDAEFCLSFSDIVENMHLIAINKIVRTEISFFDVDGHFNTVLESTGPEVRHVSMPTTWVKVSPVL